jgi:hypothetical protein
LIRTHVHLATGIAAYNEEQPLQGGAAPIGLVRFRSTPDYLFWTVRNGQSDLIAVGAGGAEHLPAPARFAAIQTGHRAHAQTGE